MKLIGIKRVDYVSQKTGKNVLGWNLYLTYPLKDDNQNHGLGCQREFISASVFNDAPWELIGTEITVSYNKYGNVDSVRKED